MQFNIHEAKTHLSKLVKLAVEGEEVVIAKRRKPLVRLVALPGVGERPTLGTGRGLVRRMGDDFDEPLTDFAEYR